MVGNDAHHMKTHQLGVASEISNVLVQRNALLGGTSLHGGLDRENQSAGLTGQAEIAHVRTLHTAMETARIALAPSLPLLSVPSSSLILSSSSFWLRGFMPCKSRIGPRRRRSIDCC